MVRAVEGQPHCTWSGRTWRYTPTHREALDAGGSRVHGGRWNPAGTFAALYLGTPRKTVLDDLAAAVRALGLSPSATLAEFALHEVYVSALRLLDLRAPDARRSAGLREEDLFADDRAECQHVGRAAWDQGLQGVLAPAALGSGLVVAAFLDRTPAGALAVERSEYLRQG